MVTISILSDTHVLDVKKAHSFFKFLNRELNNVDYIIHAGDLVTIEVLEALQDITRTYAVKGNSDLPGLDHLTSYLDLTLENQKIGVIHRLEQLDLEIRNALDICISGHTHRPEVKEIPKDDGNALLLLNPGSLTKPRAPIAKRFALEVPQAQPTFIILEIHDGISSAILKKFPSGKN